MVRERRFLGNGRLGGAVAIAVALLGWLAVPARAAGADETLLLSLTNVARAANGAPALTLDSGLSSTARRWASAMAAAGAISHNPDLKSQIPSNWSKTGENVGYGTSVDKIHASLLSSPSHLRNIVDPEFELIGIGVVRANNLVWIVEVFFAPSGSAAAPQPDSEPQAEAAAAPEPGPSRASAPPAPAATVAAEPAAASTTTTTSTTAEPSTTPTAAPAPVPGLPMRLTLMVQQVLTLGITG